MKRGKRHKLIVRPDGVWRAACKLDCWYWAEKWADVTCKRCLAMRGGRK